ncbi:hypothetical protein AAFF_G00326750, partial [Aldrovandia affinis]
MKAAIWADLHLMSTDERPIHTRCLPSWCWFLQAEQNNEDPPRNKDHRGNTFLNRAVTEKLIPVYHRMSSDNLLKRMQHGRTQNVNECLNSVIWSRCPKTVFIGKGRVKAAVGMAVATFNEGPSAISAVMDRVWLDSTLVTLNGIKAEDERRIAKADAAATDS